MLNKMRQSAGSWMIKILLGLVVLAFIFMGAGSFNSGRTNKAAEVNGKPIPVNEYQETYQRLVNQLRQRFGSRLDSEMLEMMNVRKQAMNRVVETELLRQEAERYNIDVPPAELAEMISGIPAFQKNGRFSKQQYKMVLNHNRMSPASFEALQRESLKIRKLKSILEGGIQVSEAEARQWYDWRNARVKINYALFRPEDFKDMEVDEKALAEYYEKHKKKYKTSPKAKARYVKFSPSSYLSEAEVPEEDIRAWYRNNIKEYEQPARVKARHILLKLPEGADEDLVESRREKALDIMKKANGGADFAELAGKYSEGPSSEKGGELGFFTREEMVEPFAEKAFSLEPGEISKPVRTKFGWHIIKVEEKTGKTTKKLAEVKDKIRKKLAEKKAKDKAYDEAVKMYNISFSGSDLVKNAQNREDVSVKTTGYFTREQGPEGVASPSKFAEKAFELPVMEVSDIVEIGESFYLIQTTERLESKIPDLNEIRGRAASGYKKTEQKKAAEKAARRFLEKAKAEGSIKKAGEQTGVEIKTTDFFERNGHIQGIGRDQAVSRAAFKLSEKEPFPGKPVKGSEGVYVISFSARKRPDKEPFEEKKQQVARSLLERKQADFMNAWVARLRKNSEIEITEQLIN